MDEAIVKARKGSRSGVRGVRIVGGKFQATVHTAKISHCVGTFETAEEALDARLEWLAIARIAPVLGRPRRKL